MAPSIFPSSDRLVKPALTVVLENVAPSKAEFATVIALLSIVVVELLTTVTAPVVTLLTVLTTLLRESSIVVAVAMVARNESMKMRCFTGWG